VLADATAIDLQAAHATLLARGLECTLDRRQRRLPLDEPLQAARDAIRRAAQAHGMPFRN
jgi:glutamate-ammonia-ligase adenylyltransferase